MMESKVVHDNILNYVLDVGKLKRDADKCDVRFVNPIKFNM